MMENWTPLEDIWSKLERNVREAEIEGMFSDPELAKTAWVPKELHLSDEERVELIRFSENRTGECLKVASLIGGMHPMIITSLLVQAVLAGMVWEKERIG